MAVYSSGFDNPDLHSSLLTVARYDGNGFYLRKDNYLEKLPMFLASRYIAYNKEWTQRAMIMKSGDGSQKFFKDVKNKKLEQFLLKCLLFTTLTNQNHMRTFLGSDGNSYRNELCLDGTRGSTIALRDLQDLEINNMEDKLLNQWRLVLDSARDTDNYNEDLTYGVHQISLELNTSFKNKFDETVYNYPDLNGQLNVLKTFVKDYYNSELVETLFRYEFLK